MLVNVLRYVFTIKDLKFRQLVYFFLFFFKKNFFLFTGLNHPIKQNKKKNKPFFLKKHYSFNYANKTFTFGGITRKINTNKWLYRSPNLLWEYNLFYFNFLLSDKFLKNESESFTLLHNWINFSKKKSSHVMWDSYPTSLRLINIIKLCITHGVVTHEIYESIFNHTNHIKKNLEYRLDANHLLTNLIAIDCGNKFLGFQDSTTKKFEKLLDDELNIQFKCDFHYELTPSYHNLLTEQVIDSISIKKYLNFKVDKKKLHFLEKLLRNSKYVSHPDNFPAFFNDTNFDSLNYKNLQKLFLKNFKKKINHQFQINPKYFFVLKNKKVHLISKCCGPSPIFNPGHSHADSLSFELSFGKDRFLINKGISTYTDRKQRINERSTKSHNCLAINNENTSDVWSLFRIGRKTKILERYYDTKKKIISGTQKYFIRIFKQVKHKRTWKLLSNKLTISDFLYKYNSIFTLYFHFSPNAKISFLNKKKIFFKLNKKKGIIDFSNAETIKIKNSYYYPHFGYKKPIKSIIVKCKGNKNITEIRLTT